MSVKTRATIEALYKVEGKAAPVDGEIVHVAPSREDAGFASLHIASRLLHYPVQTGQGRVYGTGVGFHVHLPHREACSPDAAYPLGPRSREALA